MGQANILIVEDETVVAADLAGKLERAGYGIIGTASRGEQAIRMAKSTPPDLILMDIRLAGPLDGVTTAECLKAFADVPVVFLTAHSDRETIKRASLTEPFGYILKPFEERDLTTQIEIALYKHQAERRLRDSEARYRALIETAIDSIVTIDGFGTIRSCNAATERMFDYRREDMVGRHISSLIPVPEAERDWASAYGVASGQSAVIGVWRELHARRRDGRLFPVEIAVSQTLVGGEVLFTGIVRDVSERKRAEGEIRWRADLLEQTHEAVIVWRIGGGIVYWNRGARELYGWTAEEAAGRFTHELLHTALPMPAEEFDRCLVEQGTWSGEVRQRTKTGAAVVVESRMVSMADSDGSPLVMETNRDVTERHAAHERICRFAEELEERVNARTQQLEQSQQRLRALATELSLTEQRERKRLATELHDHLAQLLVLGRLKLSQTKQMTDLQPRCVDLIAQTMEALDESLKYTRTMVADLSPPVLHDFGLPAALKWLVTQMQRHDLTVSVECAGDDPCGLPEDQGVLLFQSVRELLMNAAKHAGSGRAFVSLEQRDAKLSIEVRDEGKGFDVTAVDGAPTPLSSKFGLFSIKERMRAMGGWFDVQSSPGAGTRVTLAVPLGSRSKPSPKFDVQRSTLGSDNLERRTLNVEPLVRTPNVEPHRQHAKTRVLLVDDHTVVRQGLRSLLEGYADLDVAGEAGDGIEAVAMTKELRPDVVVMDLNMPKMDGVEATRHIKNHEPATIVIGLSMHQGDHYEQTMRRAGAAAYLPKDSVADHLHEMILACRRVRDGFLRQERGTAVSSGSQGESVPPGEAL